MNYEKFLKYGRQIIIDFLVDNNLVNNPDDIEISVDDNGSQTYNKESSALFQRVGCELFIFKITHDTKKDQYVLETYTKQYVTTYGVEEVEVDNDK